MVRGYVCSDHLPLARWSHPSYYYYSVYTNTLVSHTGDLAVLKQLKTWLESTSPYRAYDLLQSSGSSCYYAQL